MFEISFKQYLNIHEINLIYNIDYLKIKFFPDSLISPNKALL